jgi:hypothetical protein
LNLKRGASRHFVQPLAGLDPTPAKRDIKCHFVAVGRQRRKLCVWIRYWANSAEGRFLRDSERRQAEPYSRGNKVSLFFCIAKNKLALIMFCLCWRIIFSAPEISPLATSGFVAGAARTKSGFLSG